MLNPVKVVLDQVPLVFLAHGSDLRGTKSNGHSSPTA
jgi:hypothetical protein